MKVKMTMKKWENSKMDEKLDKKKWAPKEWSKADMKIDKAAVKKINKKLKK